MGCICISVFSIVLLCQFLASSLNCITYFYTRVCCKDAKSEEKKQPKNPKSTKSEQPKKKPATTMKAKTQSTPVKTAMKKKNEK